MGLRGECEGSFGGSQELERVGVLWEQTERGERWGCVKSGVSCQEGDGNMRAGRPGRLDHQVWDRRL